MSKKSASCFFAIALGLHYLLIRQAAPRQCQKISELFFCYCARLALSFDKTDCASAMSKKISELLFFCYCARLALSLCLAADVLGAVARLF